MEKKEQLYEGKAKKVYATDKEGYVIVSYKDDATALDGQKRGTIVGKGAINNRMTNFLMQLLSKNGVSTFYGEPCAEGVFSVSWRETGGFQAGIRPACRRNYRAG